MCIYLHVTFNPWKNPVNYLIIAAVLQKKRKEKETKILKIVW